MANEKSDELKEVELDSDLLDEFTDELETAINKVCANNADADPRLELLVTLGLFGAQVAQDSRYSKEEFLDMMSDMFDDVENSVAEDTEEENEDEKFSLSLGSKKGNQFNVN